MICRRISFLSLHLVSHHKAEEAQLVLRHHRGMFEAKQWTQNHRCSPTKIRYQLEMLLDHFVQIITNPEQKWPCLVDKHLTINDHLRLSGTLLTSLRYSTRTDRILSVITKVKGCSKTAIALRLAVWICQMLLRLKWNVEETKWRKSSATRQLFLSSPRTNQSRKFLIDHQTVAGNLFQRHCKRTILGPFSKNSTTQNPWMRRVQRMFGTHLQIGLRRK